MDLKLSEFIEKTSCEPGFARDLLNHHDWNLGLALKSYYRMKDIIVDNDQPNKLDCDLPYTKENGDYLVNNFTNKDIGTNKFSSEPSLSSHSSDVCESSIISSPSKLTINIKRDEILFIDKKLTRGISRAADNVNLVSKARSEFAQDFKTSSRGSRLLNLDKFLETPDFTFTIPDISIHEEKFCEFLKKDLIEKSTLTSLELAKRLNWWSNICQNLYPLVTSGDGNCLLHAASLGMWGFHDRGLILRRALYILLSNSLYTKAFYRRWRWQTHLQNSKTGLHFSENEWEREWENVLRMASTEPRSKTYNSSFELNGGKKDPNDYEEKSYTYESLEEIHIFVLAHVLRRPIIVIADTMLKDSQGEAFFPIPFGGIYLPLECPDDCLMKSPLCLTYDAAHFSALVAMNKENTSEALPLAIPLMDVDHKILPLHFAIDPGEDVCSQQSSKLESIFDNLSKTFILTEQDKIELIKKYFDILTLAHLKNNCADKSPKASSNVIEKSQTLPSNFGRKTEFSDAQLSGKEKSKTLTRKSSAKQILQKPFVSFGRMSKRIKKNIGHLARRSTSFRLVKQSNPTSSSTDSNTQNSQDKAITSNRLENVLTTATKSDLKRSIINTDNSIFYCDTYVLAAKLYTNKRHLYYDDMIKNYLDTARIRFVNEEQQKKLNSMPSSSTLSTSSSSSLSSSSIKSSVESLSNNGNVCVNHNCFSTASASTNYLCLKCFEEQKEALIKNNYSSKKVNSLDEKNVNKSTTLNQEGLLVESDKEPLDSSCTPKFVETKNCVIKPKSQQENDYNEDSILKIKALNTLTLNTSLPREYCIPNSL